MYILPDRDGLTYLVGHPGKLHFKPHQALSPDLRHFVESLSNCILADPESRSLPDVVAFAWWCRKANIEKQSNKYDDGMCRLGRGLAFHVAPSNVPVNFAFSWIFSLLAGNANVTRVPSNPFPQVGFLLRHIEDVLQKDQFSEIKAMNVFVTYGHDPEINRAFSAIADVRIIWGGDATIGIFRKDSLPARSLDVGFADRYSFAVINADRVIQLNESEMDRLASSFYNDAFIMNQNACSSPRLVVWVGSSNETHRARNRFWSQLDIRVNRGFQVSAVAAVDKLTQACRDAIELQHASGFEHSDNRIYRIEIDRLTPDLEDRRCGNGYFYEYSTPSLDDIAPFITSRQQTLTYFGFSPETMAHFMAQHRPPGIDRIVPIGGAMDIGLFWDGNDLIRILSRVCEIR
jgi:hypothetical protein